MITSLILLSLATSSTCYAAPKTPPQSPNSEPQTVIVFKDHEVPHFVITEGKSMKRIVIDRQRKKIGDTKIQQ